MLQTGAAVVQHAQDVSARVAQDDPMDLGIGSNPPWAAWSGAGNFMHERHYTILQRCCEREFGRCR